MEHSVAYHLHPNCQSISVSSHLSLPHKMERAAAVIYQTQYKYSAQSVCSLNAITLLTTYQAEILEEVGQDSGIPNPVLWDEICVVNDLGHIMCGRNICALWAAQVSQDEISSLLCKRLTRVVKSEVSYKGFTCVTSSFQNGGLLYVPFWICVY